MKSYLSFDKKRNTTPARLHKKEENFAIFNLPFSRTSFLICIALGLILFCILCFAVCGVSSLESGTYYNHIGGI